jgi:hypothetical protein
MRIASHFAIGRMVPVRPVRPSDISPTPSARKKAATTRRRVAVRIDRVFDRLVHRLNTWPGKDRAILRTATGPDVSRRRLHAAAHESPIGLAALNIGFGLFVFPFDGAVLHFLGIMEQTPFAPEYRIFCCCGPSGLSWATPGWVDITAKNADANTNATARFISELHSNALQSLQSVALFTGRTCRLLNCRMRACVTSRSRVKSVGDYRPWLGGKIAWPRETPQLLLIP